MNSATDPSRIHLSPLQGGQGSGYKEDKPMEFLSLIKVNSNEAEESKFLRDDEQSKISEGIFKLKFINENGFEPFFDFFRFDKLTLYLIGFGQTALVSPLATLENGFEAEDLRSSSSEDDRFISCEQRLERQYKAIKILEAKDAAMGDTTRAIKKFNLTENVNPNTETRKNQKFNFKSALEEIQQISVDRQDQTGIPAQKNSTDPGKRSQAFSPKELASQYHSLGYKERKKGNFKKAIKCYTQAIEVDPLHFKVKTKKVI